MEQPEELRGQQRQPPGTQIVCQRCPYLDFYQSYKTSEAMLIETQRQQVAYNRLQAEFEKYRKENPTTEEEPEGR